MWFLNSSVRVADSGILEGFRDCHCHLLPGVDDGVQEAEESLRILEEWEMAGVKEVWLTPHIMEDIPNRSEGLKKIYEGLKKIYTGGIALHLAAEHMMDGPFRGLLEGAEVLPIGSEGDRLLVETSYYTPPMNMAEMIEKVKGQGFVPILAHPERYQYMGKDDYKRWKSRGVLLQLNVPSLVGAYGPEVLMKAEWLLKENMYDYCGSDTHSESQVNFFMNGEIRKKSVKKVMAIVEAQEL